MKHSPEQDLVLKFHLEGTLILIPSQIQSIFFYIVHIHKPDLDRRWSQRFKLVTFKACRKGKAGKSFPFLKICADYSFGSDLKLMSFCKLFQLPTFNLL